jgi:nucleotide-binding universal stress UspA family protein
MKKILIAIDYTPSAEKVAETGYALAKALKAEVAIVHVITEPAFYAMDYSPIMGYTGGYTTGTVEILDGITKEAENFLPLLLNTLAIIISLRWYSRVKPQMQL